MVADLQLHTEASDGENTVEERVEQAKKKEVDLDTIAITDHDTINPKLNAGSQVINGVEVITGAEIKCEVNGTSIEILGYFLDPEDPSLQDLFDQMGENREERMQEMVERVNEGENLDLDYEKDIKYHANGTVGRPHLGMALEKAGIADSVNEAFEKYIGEEANTDYYVETEKLGAEEVIAAIHDSGGVASLSHPGRDLPYTEAENLVGQLAEYGIDGLEVWYTYKHKIEDGFDISFAEYLQEERGMEDSEKIAETIQAEVEELAEEYNLIKTGGSDCHGEGSGKYNIGKIQLEEKQLNNLRKARA